MASNFSILSFIPLLLILTPTAYTQDSDSLALTPDLDCGPRLLPLVSCAPFMQGSMPNPGQMCCDGLTDIYDQQPNCLCSLLNDPRFISFPINQTLALQLPLLCSLAMNISTCSGGLISTAPDSPQSPFSKGAETNPPTTSDMLQSPIPIGAEKNTSAAVSPVVALPPASRARFGNSQSASAKFQTDGSIMVAAVTTFIMLGVTIM
ncbi:hypothetical protein IFM89_020466 [Coptis chinensis]|uniref:Bifunctional inhibitor/plant lipid transfer protein/seed storage helical domain-containing protein n=1 Tax=Coptis chinensis TaxID=261450 RepID=A0A835LFV6_9MAGN|nr:hypothetical protein IFM89_020466 [Coptis chinensis]